MATTPRQTSEEVVEQLRAELECLQCSYSLRGLPGDHVRCPECGLEHDVALLLSRRWTKPWHKAPGFNRLIFPLAWLVIAGIFWLVASGITLFEFPVLSLIGAAAVVGIWLWLLLRTRKSLRIANGPFYALLAHAIFAGYIFAVWLMIAGVAAALLGGGLRLPQLMIGFLLLAVACGVFWAGRRAEKHIASLCIRQHLLGQ